MFIGHTWNVKDKTIQLLEDNMVIMTLKQKKNFLNETQKALILKDKKRNKLFIKRYHQQSKKGIHSIKGYIVTHISETGLTSKIAKEYLPIN